MLNKIPLTCAKAPMALSLWSPIALLNKETRVVLQKYRSPVLLFQALHLQCFLITLSSERQFLNPSWSGPCQISYSLVTHTCGDTALLAFFCSVHAKSISLWDVLLSDIPRNCRLCSLKSPFLITLSKAVNPSPAHGPVPLHWFIIWILGVSS